MTLKKINEKLDMMFNAGLNVPSQVERIETLKFITRTNGFYLEFETFKEVQVWFKDIMEDHIQLLEDEIDAIKEFIK